MTMTSNTRTLALLLLAVMLAVAPIIAADHSCCPRGKVTVETPTKIGKAVALKAPSMPVLFALFQPTSSVQPEAFMKSMLNNEPQHPACGFMHFISDWKAWRARNPHAKSRYPGLNSDEARSKLSAVNLEAVAALSVQQDMCDEMDCEPSFAVYGPCGCSLQYALSSGGCGWFHSQVGNIQFLKQ